MMLCVLNIERACTNFVKQIQITVVFLLRLQNEKWMDVQVGDIIKLENNQFVTVSTLSDTFLLQIREIHGFSKLRTQLYIYWLFCVFFRLISCCSPAVNHLTWCTLKQQSWMGESVLSHQHCFTCVMLPTVCLSCPVVPMSSERLT